MRAVTLSDRSCVGKPGSGLLSAPGRVAAPGPAQLRKRTVITRTRVALDDTRTLAPNGVTSLSSAPVDFDELNDLIRMVDSTDIVELELFSKRFNLSVKKREALEGDAARAQALAPPPAYAAAPPPPAYAPPPPPPPAAAAPAPAAAAPPAAAPAAAPAAPAAVDGVEVTSPMSGTFYGAPAPGEPAFVKEGDRVTKGQTICIIEAMKLMNEIEADVSGTIVKIVAENGKPVAPGSGLFVIKP